MWLIWEINKMHSEFWLGKPEGRRTLGSPHRREDNIEMVDRYDEGHKLNSYGSGQGQVNGGLLWTL
jgi:hypothetical protein